MSTDPIYNDFQRIVLDLDKISESVANLKKAIATRLQGSGSTKLDDWWATMESLMTKLEEVKNHMDNIRDHVNRNQFKEHIDFLANADDLAKRSEKILKVIKTFLESCDELMGKKRLSK